jgi:hypothetical protein
MLQNQSNNVTFVYEIGYLRNLARANRLVS